MQYIGIFLFSSTKRAPRNKYAVKLCISCLFQAHNRRYTEVPLSGATCPHFSMSNMRLTGQKAEQPASTASLLARKCRWLARAMAVNMRNAICARTQTSKVPTRVGLLFFSLFCGFKYKCHIINFLLASLARSEQWNIRPQCFCTNLAL